MRKLIMSSVVVICLLASANLKIASAKGNLVPVIIADYKTAEVVLSSRNVLDGKLELLLPKEFDLMSKELLEVKYPDVNRPTVVYSNGDGTVSIAINHTANAISYKELPQVLPAFEQQFNSIFPDIKWHKKELTKINKQDFIILQFETPAADMEIYNSMAITSLDGRMLMVSFNCPADALSQWKSRAAEIVGSIKVK